MKSRATRSRRRLGVAARVVAPLLAISGLGAAHAVPGAPPAALQARRDTHWLADRPRAISRQDSNVTCFEGDLSEAASPACFDVDNPPPGWQECVSRSTYFAVQYIDPGFSSLHRVKALGFISNDVSTVFPSVGVVLIPITQDSRYPTEEELQHLQIFNAMSDTTGVVVVNLQPYDLLVPPHTWVVVCLQFPAGGQLIRFGVGPGILADNTLPDQGCDRFTLDAGRPNSWYEPAYDPGVPGSLPLDWGFVVTFEPATSLVPMSWSAVKHHYRSP